MRGKKQNNECFRLHFLIWREQRAYFVGSVRVATGRGKRKQNRWMWGECVGQAAAIVVGQLHYRALIDA